MRNVAPLMLAVLLVACQKDEPAPVSVEVSTICFRCSYEYTHNGASTLDNVGEALPPDTVPQPVTVERHAFLALPGDIVSITAQALQASHHAVMVSVSVDGFQQAMQYHKPLPPADTTLAVEIRMVVPHLDKYGVAFQ